MSLQAIWWPAMRALRYVMHSPLSDPVLRLECLRTTTALVRAVTQLSPIAGQLGCEMVAAARCNEHLQSTHAHRMA